MGELAPLMDAGEEMFKPISDIGEDLESMVGLRSVEAAAARNAPEAESMFKLSQAERSPMALTDGPPSAHLYTGSGRGAQMAVPAARRAEYAAQDVSSTGTGAGGGATDHEAGTYQPTALQFTDHMQGGREMPLTNFGDSRGRVNVPFRTRAREGLNDAGIRASQWGGTARARMGQGVDRMGRSVDRMMAPIDRMVSEAAMRRGERSTTLLPGTMEGLPSNSRALVPYGPEGRAARQVGSFHPREFTPIGESGASTIEDHFSSRGEQHIPVVSTEGANVAENYMPNVRSVRPQSSSRGFSEMSAAPGERSSGRPFEETELTSGRPSGQAAAQSETFARASQDASRAASRGASHPIYGRIADAAEAGAEAIDRRMGQAEIGAANLSQRAGKALDAAQAAGRDVLSQGKRRLAEVDRDFISPAIEGGKAAGRELKRRASDSLETLGEGAKAAGRELKRRASTGLADMGKLADAKMAEYGSRAKQAAREYMEKAQRGVQSMTADLHDRALSAGKKWMEQGGSRGMAAIDGLKQQASSRALQMAHEYAPMAEKAAKGAVSDALDGLHSVGAKGAEAVANTEEKAKKGMSMMDKAMLGMMGVQTVEDVDGSKNKEAPAAPYQPNINISSGGGYGPTPLVRSRGAPWSGGQYGYVN